MIRQNENDRTDHCINRFLHLLRHIDVMCGSTKAAYGGCES